MQLCSSLLFFQVYITVMMILVIVAFLVCLVSYVYRSLKPPPPRICGVPHGPPVTSPRIRLSDGRFLAYRESGVDRASANYKIIVVHGFNSSKDMEFPISKVLPDTVFNSCTAICTLFYSFACHRYHFRNLITII